jgi:hypothetical protein
MVCIRGTELLMPGSQALFSHQVACTNSTIKMFNMFSKLARTDEKSDVCLDGMEALLGDLNKQ